MVFAVRLFYVEFYDLILEIEVRFFSAKLGIPQAGYNRGAGLTRFDPSCGTMNKILVLLGKGRTKFVLDMVGEYRAIYTNILHIYTGEWKQEVASINSKFLFIDNIAKHDLTDQRFVEFIGIESFMSGGYYAGQDFRYDVPFTILCPQYGVTKEDFVNSGLDLSRMEFSEMAEIFQETI